MNGNDPKTDGENAATGTASTDEGSGPKVIVDQSLLDEAADQGGTKTAPMPDNGTDDEDEFQIPKADLRGIKYVGLGLLVLLLLAGVAYVGTRMTKKPLVDTGAGGTHATAPAAPDSADASTSSEAPNASMPPSSPSGNVTVTARAFDTFDLSNCTRQDLEITSDGVWIFRNCARPVLPSSGHGQ